MKIKTCPFCGGAADFNATYTPRYRRWYVKVKCSVCDGSGRAFQTAVDPELDYWDSLACHRALAAWNNRSGDGEQDS